MSNDFEPLLDLDGKTNAGEVSPIVDVAISAKVASTPDFVKIL